MEDLIERKMLMGALSSMRNDILFREDLNLESTYSYQKFLKRAIWFITDRETRKLFCNEASQVNNPLIVTLTKHLGGRIIKGRVMITATMLTTLLGKFTSMLSPWPIAKTSKILNLMHLVHAFILFKLFFLFCPRRRGPTSPLGCSLFFKSHRISLLFILNIE